MGQMIVGEIGEFSENTLHAAKAGTHDLLILRRGAKIFAVDSICPHAGGKLAEGVLDGDCVICPWHKAAFSIIDGNCTEPPAVDRLGSYPACIADGRVVVTIPDAPAPAAVPHARMDERCFAILGAGAAGFSAAQELRRSGFSGRIALISAEAELPYDRTIQSKYVLAGAEAGEKSPLQDESYFRIAGIERLTRRIAQIDAGAKEIRFVNGETLGYEAALVALGGTPKRPEMPGAELPGVFMLRSATDAARIAQAAEGAKHVVVMGESFIGMEAAAALRQRDLSVTVVGRQSEPFEKQLGAQIGAVIRKLHEEKGVEFRLGAEVSAFEGRDRVQAVRLRDGALLPADLVVIGLGIAPATELLQGIALNEDGGIPVDRQLRAGDGLFAAGDVAAFPLYGEGAAIRVEHWRVAEQHGRVAARAMLGLDAAYTQVPYFWTSHFMKRLDYVGHAAGDDEMVLRGDLAQRQFIAYYLRNGTVAAAAGMNEDQNMAAVLALMGRRKDWTVEALHPAGSKPSEILEKQK